MIQNEMKDGIHLTHYQTTESTAEPVTRLQRPLSSSPDLPSLPESAALTTASSGSTDLNKQKPTLFDMRLLTDSLVESHMSRNEASTLEDALRNLRMTLEDYQGQFPELQKLEEQIISLDRLVRVSSSQLN